MMRKTTSLFTNMTTVEVKMTQEVEVVDYKLVDVPSSNTDWGFMKKKRVSYTRIVKEETWVAIEVRPATEEEIVEAMEEMFPL